VPVEVVMPKLGLTMASGTITRWLKIAGDEVSAGEPLVEISTDKITYEVEAPASGLLARTFGSDGDEFVCGAAIATIALAGDEAAAVNADRAPDLAAAAGFVEAPRRPPAANGISGPLPEPRRGTRIIASPAARRLARERNVRLGDVRGTGPRGRITLSDVHGHSAAREPVPVPVGFPPELAPSRRTIFRKMTAVGQLPLAQVETNVRVDAVKELMERRGDFRWTAFTVFAIARLLRSHADLRTDAASGAPFARIGIGVAADTPGGLIVPVVHDADTRSLAEVEAEIVRLAGLARAGALMGDDVAGACFSISNVGPQGIERVAPLPDPPQTAILGIGAAAPRPAVVDGALAIAWTMTCVLTFDHRFIDGAPAARFLAAFAAACSAPGTLL
jgi:pyruvate dehydrogenase E2 component (dihydrolipoamide acetyltransferase)